MLLQLFCILEADADHQIISNELCLAVASWLKMGEPAHAQAALQRHSQLTGDWSSAQQQHCFKAAVQLIKPNPAPAVVQLAVDICMLAVSNTLPDSSSQVQELVQALLAAKRHHEAYDVSMICIYVFAAVMSKLL